MALVESVTIEYYKIASVNLLAVRMAKLQIVFGADRQQTDVLDFGVVDRRERKQNTRCKFGSPVRR